MPFLNLKRLLPSRKMWKVFTNKLRKKLRKLNRFKATKKSHRNSKRATSRLGWPSLSIRPKKFKPRPKLIRPSIHLQRRAPPVYVDQLFMDPDTLSASTTKEEPKPGKKIVVTSDHEKSNSAEETLGINERAEEFIARFRRQMRHQELLDRHLL